MSVAELLQQSSEIKDKDPRAQGEAMEQIALEIVELGDSALPELLEAIKNSNSLVSRTAKIALNHMNSDTTFREIVSLLQNGDNTQKTFTLNWIQKNPRPEAIAPLVELLKNAEQHIKHKVLGVLARMDYPETVTALTEIVQLGYSDNKDNVALAGEAMKQLKKYENQEAVQATLEEYRQQAPQYLALLLKRPTSVNNILDILAEINTEESLSLVIDYLNNIKVDGANNLSRKDTIISSLEKHASDSPIAQEAIENYKQNLVSYLTIVMDTDKYQYKNAATRLNTLGTEEALDVLIERLLKGETQRDQNLQKHIATQIKVHKDKPKVAEALEKYEASLN